MFDTKTFINKTNFIGIFIGIKVIRYYLANLVCRFEAFATPGLLKVDNGR